MLDCSRGVRPAERGLVAAYFEGLLDEAEAARVRRLIDNDPAWAAEAKRQRRLAELLAAWQPPDAEGARQRVWGRLLRAASEGRRVPFLRRRVEVPVPLAIAAGVLVLVLSMGLVHVAGRGHMGTVRITTIPNGVKQVQIEARIGDLQQLMRELEVDASGRELIISLPEPAQGFVIGEPLLLRASDMVKGRSP